MERTFISDSEDQNVQMEYFKGSACQGRKEYDKAIEHYT